MDDDDRRPDHTEDPRGQDTGQGYPESQPAGANPGGKTPEDDEGTDAPSSSSRHESDPGTATGNPEAAGGD